MKRVLIPVHWLTDFGGLHDNVIDTAEALVAGGWQVTVIAPPSKVGPRFAAIGARLIEDAMEDVAASIAAALAQGPFDLVHAHPFQARRIGIGVAEALGIPLTVTIHGQYDDEFAQYGAAVQAVVCVCSRIAEFVAATARFLRERVVAIPNGVDFAAFSGAGGARHGGDKTVIAVASRLDPDKGVLALALAELIHALPSMAWQKNVELRVAGDRFYGPVSNPLTEALDRAEASGVAVVRTGWLAERAALRQFFAEADVVIAPGRAAMEAIACETPTIAAASRGYLGLVTADNLGLAHATNFGGVQEDATLYRPGAIIEDLGRALRMSAAETAALRRELHELHDLRRVQELHRDLADRLVQTRVPPLWRSRLARLSENGRQSVLPNKVNFP